MTNADILSDSFLVAWDESLNSLVILHPDSAIPRPVVQIRAATLSEMSFAQASSFLGERLILLIPALRERYVDPTIGRVDGATDA